MSDVVREVASKIEDMSIRGAGKIARAGAEALRDYAEAYLGNDLGDYKKSILEAYKILLDSRPTAVSLMNGLQATVKDLDNATTLDEAKASVIKNANEFSLSSKTAVKSIAEYGAKRIRNGDTIMTHCNSSAALGVIIEAHRQGKDIKVYATESRPWKQGILTVTALAEAGVDVTLIIDSAVRTVMRKVDSVFVGADTITSNGALINKIGTSQLALAADEARVRFNVCAETYKFSPSTMFGEMVTVEERDIGEILGAGTVLAGVKVFNPVFDSTPAKYIDSIITELGVMAPGSVYETMIRKYGTKIFQ